MDAELGEETEESLRFAPVVLPPISPQILLFNRLPDEFRLLKDNEGIRVQEIED